jgi:molybdopterin molybdotransferase
MIPVDEAIDRILAKVPDLGTETVSLAEAHGRVLAEPILATHNQPPFDSSAMDGYAVRAEDVEPMGALRVAGTSQAGQRFVGMMQRGQCVRIFTGAPLPIGADAVIMQEDARVEGATVKFIHKVTPGDNIRKRAMDFHEGDELLPAGLIITPAATALAAAANHTTLEVARRPVIAILSTGDELVRPGVPLGPDQIVASNAYALVALLHQDAADILDLGIVSDNKLEIENAVLRAIDAGVDVLITTGGASVGERDYVQEVLVGLGVELDFWKIAMRPGKPLMFGTRGKTLIFGLPGNPVSAFVTATVIVQPGIRAMGRHPAPRHPVFLAPLTAAIPPNGPRRHYIRGQLDVTDSGFLTVTPIAETDSSHLSSLARADALIVQPENDRGRGAETLIPVMPLGWR